jgi:hypothetical protein
MRFVGLVSKIQLLVLPLFILLLTILVIGSPPLVSSQTSNPTDLSYDAFRQLEGIYRSGGQAPALVAKMNSALNLIEEAHSKRTQGDVADATRLENEARSIIQSVLSAVPEAQQKAASDSANKVYIAVALVPIGAFLSAAIFYATLRTWRYYERLKLYEMRIVEKKTES